MTQKDDRSVIAKDLINFTDEGQLALDVTDLVKADQGHLRHDQCRTSLEFTFQYEGYWFAARSTRREHDGLLQIHAVLGYLPYSFESQFLRANIMAVVRAAGRKLGGRIKVDERQRILLMDEIKVNGIMTPTVVLSRLTTALILVKPYLELLRMIQPPR